MGLGCGHSISKLINNERAKAKYAANMELCKQDAKKAGWSGVGSKVVPDVTRSQ